MKIVILGGFLGSGKTSVLLPMAHFLVDHAENSDRKVKVAIIENEIGDIGIDDQFIRNDGYNVRNLFGGCACCSLAGELATSIHAIRNDLNPEWLIIEATGVAYPNGIRQEIKHLFEFESKIICIADAKRWAKIAVALKHVITGQVEDATAVFINKTDLVDAQVQSSVVRDIRALNPDTRIYPICATQGIEENIFKEILL